MIVALAFSFSSTRDGQCGIPLEVVPQPGGAKKKLLVSSNEIRLLDSVQPATMFQSTQTVQTLSRLQSC